MAPERDGALVVRALGWTLLLAGLRLFAGMVLMATAVAPDVRNIFRTRRLAWDEIEDVGPRERSFNLWFTLRGGKRIVARAAGSISSAERERIASVLRAARPETVR